MLQLAGLADSEDAAREKLREVIDDGSALNKLADFVEAQGGNRGMVYEPQLLPKASITTPLYAPCDGYIGKIVCDEVGICSLILGGGRETKESVIDLSVGIVLEKKVGDYVRKGEILAVIHANDEKKAKACEERLLAAYRIDRDKKDEGSVIRGLVK